MIGRDLHSQLNLIGYLYQSIKQINGDWGTQIYYKLTRRFSKSSESYYVISRRSIVMSIERISLISAASPSLPSSSAPAWTAWTAWTAAAAAKNVGNHIEDRYNDLGKCRHVFFAIPLRLTFVIALTIDMTTLNMAERTELIPRPMAETIEPCG